MGIARAEGEPPETSAVWSDFHTSSVKRGQFQELAKPEIDKLVKMLT